MIQNSFLLKAIIETILQTLEERGLYQDMKVPYVAVADDIFTSKSYLVKLYFEKLVFNYHMRRVGRIVKIAFGILESRFRDFLTVSPQSTTQIVLAGCALHIFLQTKVL